MSKEKKGLGKGLGALFSIYDNSEFYDDVEETKQTKQETKQENVISQQTVNSVQTNTKDGVTEIDIQKVYPNPNQPRKNFEPEALQELCNSIKIHGVIQPIIVNKDVDNNYMIIAGERRYRASKLAGLQSIPCIVKNYTERQIKEISIIENLQREDLNPIEAARAIKQLMDEYGFTQEVVAERIGISRPNIANTLRLLSLSGDVIKLIEQGKLSAGHARCLVVLPNIDDQLKFAMLAVKDKVTVRDLEKLVKKHLKPKTDVEKAKLEQSIELKELVAEMQRVFATKVSVLGNDNKGRIYIDYYSRDDLDRIAELIELVQTKKLTLKDLSDFNKKNIRKG